MAANKDIYVIYSYDLSKENKSKKVRFVYALKGRNKEEGLVKSLNGKFLADACFMVPLKKDREMQSIFKLWNVKYKRMKVMLIN